MSLRKEDEVSFPRSFQIVFNAIPPICKKLKWKVERIDEPLGRITTKVGMSLMSMGEDIIIQVRKLDENTTAVSIASQSKWQDYRGLGGDWGKNQKNIQKLISELNDYFSED